MHCRQDTRQQRDLVIACGSWLEFIADKEVSGSGIAIDEDLTSTRLSADLSV
jgi:hypothetical protein